MSLFVLRLFLHNVINTAQYDRADRKMRLLRLFLHNVNAAQCVCVSRQKDEPVSKALLSSFISSGCDCAVNRT